MCGKAGTLVELLFDPASSSSSSLHAWLNNSYSQGTFSIIPTALLCSTYIQLQEASEGGRKHQNTKVSYYAPKIRTDSVHFFSSRRRRPSSSLFHVVAGKKGKIEELPQATGLLRQRLCRLGEKNSFFFSFLSFFSVQRKWGEIGLTSPQHSLQGDYPSSNGGVSLLTTHTSQLQAQ